MLNQTVGQQLCYAHGIKLAVVDTFYTKSKNKSPSPEHRSDEFDLEEPKIIEDEKNNEFDEIYDDERELI